MNCRTLAAKLKAATASAIVLQASNDLQEARVDICKLFSWAGSQVPRWPQAARRPQAARWAQCTDIDIHFFSGRQTTSSSIRKRFGQILIVSRACDYLN